MNKYTAYAKTDMTSMDQVGMEARALIKSASALNEIKDNWETKQNDLLAALDKNRLLWTVIASEIREKSNPQPEQIKNNILNLALFIFQRTVDIMANPEPKKLEIMITINMNIAKGLSEHNPDGAVDEIPPAPANTQEESTSEEDILENPLEDEDMK